MIWQDADLWGPLRNVQLQRSYAAGIVLYANRAEHRLAAECDVERWKLTQPVSDGHFARWCRGSQTEHHGTMTAMRSLNTSKSRGLKVSNSRARASIAADAITAS